MMKAKRYWIRIWLDFGPAVKKEDDREGKSLEERRRE